MIGQAWLKKKRWLSRLENNRGSDGNNGLGFASRGSIPEVVCSYFIVESRWDDAHHFSSNRDTNSCNDFRFESKGDGRLRVKRDLQ